MSESEDASDLHWLSRPSGRFGENGREIRLLGPPILAWDPATNNLSVPEEYRQHPLVRRRYFYTLPLQVLDAVVAEIGVEHFDTDLLAMERQLSGICGDHTIHVGFWQNVVLPYRELRPKEMEPFPDDLIRENEQIPAVINHSSRIFRERDSGLLNRFARGYCGWLMTNPTFLDEHDALLATHIDAVLRWGTNLAAAFLPETYRSDLISGTDPNDDKSWRQFVADFFPFLLRWRLAGLAGPRLPVPIQPLMAGCFPLSVVRQLMGTGAVFYLPDTMPIPGKGHLRSLLDQTLHSGESPQHLDAWLDIVRADNTAKNRMDPFVRLLELQHYWRILRQRHASSISRRLGKCQIALARTLNVRLTQIKRDLTHIRRRLGEGWEESERLI